MVDEKAAFRDVLAENYRGYVRSIACWLHRRYQLGTWISEDELASVGYLALVVAAGQADPERVKAFGGFVLIRCRGAMLDFIRKEFRARHVSEIPDLPDERVVPIELAIAEMQARTRLRVVLESLPEEEKAALELLYDEEMTTREAGQVLGIDHGTVSRRRKSALGRMRERIAA